MYAFHIFIGNKWSKKLERCLLTANNTMNQNPLNCCHHVISDKKKGVIQGKYTFPKLDRNLSIRQVFCQKVLMKQEVTETRSSKGQYTKLGG